MRYVSTPTLARAVALLLVAAVLATSLSALPGKVSANAGPFILDGTVTDDVGRKIAGVPIVAVMRDGATVVDTQSGTTDDGGFYTITLGTDKWQPGFTVTATATWNSVQVSDTVTVGADPFATIDLQFPFEIPQFGSLLGFVVAAGLVGAVAAVFLVRKTK